MSLRTVLVSGLLALSIGILVIVGLVGALSIRGSVVEEAQRRVDHDLDSALLIYEQLLETRARQFACAFAPANGEGNWQTQLGDLTRKRQALGFTLLNVCDSEGRPLAGSYPDSAAPVPLSEDPVLRRALTGDPSHGTLRLSAPRLRQEGGSALLAQLRIPAAAAAEGAATEAALFEWFAHPLLDGRGRTVALAYGGIAINHNVDLVDGLQQTIFGTETFAGKPLGTVTLFLDGVRVATNVRGPGGLRALGTQVSTEVRREVLEKGRRWRSRALVVDAWYLSGYLPLRDPDGEILGMLYVGLLEAPYDALRDQLLRRFLIPVAITLALGVAVILVLLPRITGPLRSLRQSALRLRAGDWSAPVPDEHSISEVTELAAAFRQMQAAIAQRDAALRETNASLAETNVQLQKVNANYMSTLGFVTHELKSPLAAMQGFVDLLAEGTVGKTDEVARGYLVRVKRNCEELQDMVKDYLDLSRAERGELQAEMAAVDFCADVVDPCVLQAAPLFASRGIALERDCDGDARLVADAGLLRIALGNFLSNAAKYGREGGKARLQVRVHAAGIEASVYNEGEGFAAAESAALFAKFSRLKNANTKTKRGSGLGLFLAQQIVALHGGRVWAESEPGHWARFSLELPRPS
jgi:two-component system NtrC family sensor kinase